MKTIAILAVMVSIFTAAKCFPSGPTNETEFGPADAGSSHFQVFGDRTSNSTKENATVTESPGLTIFGFHLPPVFQFFLNETSNSTKDRDSARVGDTFEIDTADYSFDSKDQDDEEDEAHSVAGVDEYGELIYNPAVVNEENERDYSSVAGHFGDKIANPNNRSNETVSNSSPSSVHPSIIFETIILETDVLDNKNKTSSNETGRDVGDVFYRSGIPAFPYESGLSQTTENSKDLINRDNSFSVGSHHSRIPSSSNDGNFALFGSAPNLHSGFVASSFDYPGAVHSDSSSFVGAPIGDVTAPGSSDPAAFGVGSSSGISSSAGIAPSGVSSQNFNSDHLGSRATLGVGSGTFASDAQHHNNGETSFSSSSGADIGSDGYSSVASNNHGSQLQRRSALDLDVNVTESERKEPVHYKPVVDFISLIDQSKSSVHRRAAPDFDIDTPELENTTHITVIASVSSSADNFHSKIYDSVNPDFGGGSFSASSNSKNDSAPLHFGSDAVFGSSSSVAAGQPSIYSIPESEDAESTTQAAYDEEAAIVQRQRLAELRRKFLEGESRVEDAESRVEDVESRVEDAEERVEDAEFRVENAESRVENAESRVEDAESRVEDAESDED